MKEAENITFKPEDFPLTVSLGLNPVFSKWKIHSSLQNLQREGGVSIHSFCSPGSLSGCKTFQITCSVAAKLKIKS